MSVGVGWGGSALTAEAYESKKKEPWHNKLFDASILEYRMLAKIKQAGCYKFSTLTAFDIPHIKSGPCVPTCLATFTETSVQRLPGGPVAKTPRSQSRGSRFNSLVGKLDPEYHSQEFERLELSKTWCSQINKLIFKKRNISSLSKNN